MSPKASRLTRLKLLIYVMCAMMYVIFVQLFASSHKDLFYHFALKNISPLPSICGTDVMLHGGMSC
jgi:hypothetical protein